MPDEPLPSVFKTTAMDPVGRADPHPRLDRLRRECPVMFDQQLGGFFVTRLADARGVLSDRNMLRNPDAALPEARAMHLQRPVASPGSRDFGHPSATMLFLDNPDHARIRGPFARALTARVAAAKPMITEVIATTLASIATRKSFDIVADYAQQIPIRVISRLLGVPTDTLDDFRSWAEAASLALHPMRSAEAKQRMVAGQNALHDCLIELIIRYRADPGENLISDLVKDQKSGASLTDHEIQANVRLLLIAGNLTTTDLIGNTVWLLLSNPDQLAMLREDFAFTARAVEEALRMESPIDATDRVAPADISIGGCPVSAGQALTISLRAANRDPAAFERPHAFDIARREWSHVAFGGGAHFCVGAPLARIEAQMAVRALLESFSTLALADAASPPIWRALPPFRGLKELRVQATT